MSRIEETILKNLIYNEEYARKTIPFLHKDLFSHQNEQILFSAIDYFYSEYGKPPTKEALEIELDKKSMSEDMFKACKEKLQNFSLAKDETVDLNWLVDSTEEFCKEKSVFNAIMESIHIIEGKDPAKTQNAIPEILSEALAVSFDTNIGHDFIEDSDKRYEFYHKKEEKLSFDLEYFNKITDGGIPNKTLNILLAGTGVGKSMFMCHMAANYLTQNLNVLYITCEMSEERIAERIDANLMDISLDDLKKLPKTIYDKKINHLKSNIKGKLLIKEYPTSVANTTHFRHLLNELKLKKKFEPDVIFVDYLNICSSARIKLNSAVNSYTFVKSIAEELRGLAVEKNVPIWSATQTNRTGFVSSDVGLENTSESFGLPATADFMFALIATEELDELGQMLVKQLKNRYNDLAQNKKFVVGVNRSKMKFFDVEQEAQDELIENKINNKKDVESWNF